MKIFWTVCKPTPAASKFRTVPIPSPQSMRKLCPPAIKQRDVICRSVFFAAPVPRNISLFMNGLCRINENVDSFSKHVLRHGQRRHELDTTFITIDHKESFSTGLTDDVIAKHSVSSPGFFVRDKDESYFHPHPANAAKFRMIRQAGCEFTLQPRAFLFRHFPNFFFFVNSQRRQSRGTGNRRPPKRRGDVCSVHDRLNDLPLDGSRTHRGTAIGNPL